MFWIPFAVDREAMANVADFAQEKSWRGKPDSFSTYQVFLAFGCRCNTSCHFILNHFRLQFLVLPKALLRCVMSICKAAESERRTWNENWTADVQH